MRLGGFPGLAAGPRVCPSSRERRSAEIEQRPGDDQAEIIAERGEYREHHQWGAGQRSILHELALLDGPHLGVVFFPAVQGRYRAVGVENRGGWLTGCSLTAGTAA